VTDLPDDLRYTKEHEWARSEGDRIVVGITAYAQEQLGDVVYVGLPDPGTDVVAGTPLGEVESTKSVSDIYSPVTGKVADKNAEVESAPELVNEDPYGRGWLVAIDAPDARLDDLLDASAYGALIEEES
jgi:glycine cleavage system H protein